MKKWKYTTEKKRIDFSEYLQLDRDKEYKIKVKMPEIIKKLIDGNYRTVFVGTVIELDGEKIEKLIIIKNFNNVEFLKKKTRKKKEIEFSLTRRYDEDNMETYFDFVF